MQVPPPPPPSNFYVRKCPDVQCFTPVGHPSTYLTLSTIRANITNYFFRLSSDDIISFKSQCRLKDASSCVSTFTVLENTPPNRQYVVISFYKTYITKGKSHASRCRGRCDPRTTCCLETQKFEAESISKERGSQTDTAISYNQYLNDMDRGESKCSEYEC